MRSKIELEQTAVRARLGDPIYLAEYTKGLEMTLDEAIRDAAKGEIE